MAEASASGSGAGSDVGHGAGHCAGPTAKRLCSRATETDRSLAWMDVEFDIHEIAREPLSKEEPMGKETMREVRFVSARDIAACISW